MTVTGPGGAGKTRLAGQVARGAAGRFADGAWLAELAPVGDPALVAAVVAAALGVREQPGVPLAGALARALARRQLLLVLDNCEHVIGAAAELCAGLLGACDDVRVLATSREPLRMAGEARYRLGPLSLPDGGDPAGAVRSEAVALFADRARQVDARFVLDEVTGPAVARLVARLDGMPLAIELAAARVEALGVGQLADRLDDRFGLLTAGDRLAPSRQRSLAAAVEWSYRLLDERERAVFRALSVFPGPFTLEAAEAVAGPGAGAVVLRLVDCSLLVPPRAGPDGRSRYAHAGDAARLCGPGCWPGPGEDAQAAAALAGWAVGVAEEASAGLQTVEGEAPAARWLDAEDATIRQALDWAAEHDPAAALRLAVGAGLVVVPAGPAGGQLPAAAPGRRPRRAGQRRVVLRDVLAGLHGAVVGGSGGLAEDFHRAAGRGRRPGAVPGAGRCPGRPVDSIEPDGPVRRGGRGGPPVPGRGPAGRLPAGRGARSRRPERHRRSGRRSGQRRAGWPGGRADHRRRARRGSPVLQPQPGSQC